MENKAIAVYIKTESCDEYLFVYNREMTAYDITAELILRLDEEVGYITRLIITTNYVDEINEKEVWEAVENVNLNR